MKKVKKPSFTFDKAMCRRARSYDKLTEDFNRACDEYLPEGRYAEDKVVSGEGGGTVRLMSRDHTQCLNDLGDYLRANWTLREIVFFCRGKFDTCGYMDAGKDVRYEVRDLYESAMTLVGAVAVLDGRGNALIIKHDDGSAFCFDHAFLDEYEGLGVLDLPFECVRERMVALRTNFADYASANAKSSIASEVSKYSKENERLKAENKRLKAENEDGFRRISALTEKRG